MAIIQVWSDPSCQPGAVCYGALYPVVTAGGSESVGSPASFRVTVPRSAVDVTGVSEGHCLRVISQARGEQWWFVSSVTDSDGDSGLVQITGGPLQQLLTIRGFVRDGATFDFTPGRRTITDLLNTYVFTNLASSGGDNIQWLSLGTIDFQDTVDIGAFSRIRRWEIISRIEKETGHTARLRPVFSGGTLFTIALDIVEDLGDGLDTARVSSGAGATTITRTRDALRAGTAITPFGASGDTMDYTQWVVGSFTPGTPAWIPLTDPVSGNPNPIREDGQGIGWYLQKADGSTLVILDSRASDSAVQVASSGGMTAGDRVTFHRDNTGAPVIELTSPSGLAGSQQRTVASVQTRITDVRRNYVRNGTLTGTSGSTFTSWTGGVPYARTTSQAWSALCGTITSGVTYTTLPYSGATPGSIVLPYEWIRISAGGSTQWVQVTSQHVVPGGGSGTLSISSWTAPANYTSANALNVVTANGSTTLTSSRRPASFPTEVAADNVAFVTSSMVGTNAWAVYDSARPYVRAAFGMSAKADAATTLTSERPSAKIYAPTGAVTIATATYGSDFAPGDDVDFTLECGASLASSRLIRAEVTAGDVTKLTTFVRWASIWLDDSLTSDSMGPQSDSASNLLWHRAQDVLANQGTGVRYTVRGVDLALLSQNATALALGQSVRLRSPVLGLDTTVKVVKLDYTFDAQETLNLELGTVTPRLSGVTVSL